MSVLVFHLNIAWVLPFSPPRIPVAHETLAWTHPGILGGDHVRGPAPDGGLWRC